MFFIKYQNFLEMFSKPMYIDRKLHQNSILQNILETRNQIRRVNSNA